MAEKKDFFNAFDYLAFDIEANGFMNLDLRLKYSFFFRLLFSDNRYQPI